MISAPHVQIAFLFQAWHFYKIRWMTFYCQDADKRNIINSRPLNEKERYELYQEINNIQNRINFLNKLSDGKLD